MPKLPPHLRKKVKRPKAKTTGDACVACGGTGSASRGGSCVPCMGTGKLIQNRQPWNM